MKSKELKKLKIEEDSRILIIYPHPDDEAFSVCGLMQKIINEKIDFKLVIFSKGEASTLRYGLSEGEDLGEARRKEFLCFTKTLGIKNSEMLDFKDKGLEEEFNRVKKTFLNLITDYKPTVVITYEPSGIYGHPDHIALTKIVEEVKKERNSFKLIYSTVPESFKINESSLNMAKEPEKIKPLIPNVVLRLSLFESIKKLKALNCYKSQMGVNKKTLGGIFKYFPQFIKLITLFRNEYFVKNST